MGKRTTYTIRFLKDRKVKIILFQEMDKSNYNYNYNSNKNNILGVDVNTSSNLFSLSEGQESDISILAKEIIRLKKLSIQYLAKQTNKSIEDVSKDIERDFYMSAEDAKEYGIVDHVMQNRK